MALELEDKIAWETEKRQAVTQDRDLNWDLYYPNAETEEDGTKIIFNAQGARVPDESKDKKAKKAAEEAHKTDAERDAKRQEEVEAAAVAALPTGVPDAPVLEEAPEVVEEEVVVVEPDEFDDLVESGELVDVKVEDEKK